MPRKSEKIKIAGTQFDGRIKITPEMKEEIKANPLGLSQRKLAEMFGISRSSVRFIQNPEKLDENKKRREERGGWKQYQERYDHTTSIRETRNKKEKLFRDGKIELPTDKDNFPAEK